MSRRIEALEEGEPSTAGTPGTGSGSAQSQKKISVKLASNLFINLPEGLSELSYSRIGKTRMIACFMIDGSDRYTAMTINAINSFLKATPEMHAGVLVPPSWGLSIFATRVVPHLIAPERVIFKKWRQHFDQWNPTQYKLDILQFADEYDVVLWLDSDTIVYDDLRPLLFAFHKSPAKYMFVRDHVCFNPDFLNNWPFKDSNGGAFVPQACFMGFKAEHMKRLFDVWENTWRQWIQPEPFANYPDPLPSFPGSKFCIEQYALGQALTVAEILEEDILEIARSHIVLNTRSLAHTPGSHSPHGAAHTGTATAGSTATGGQAQGQQQLQQQAGQSVGASGDWSGQPSSHYLATSALQGLTSYGALSSYLGSYGALSSYQGSYGSSYWSSYTSYGHISGGSNVTYFDGRPMNASTSSSSASGGGSGQGGDWASGGDGAGGGGGGGGEGWQHPALPEHIAMDNLGACVVHFYNSFYDAAHYWWSANEDSIVLRLKHQQSWE